MGDLDKYGPLRIRNQVWIYIGFGSDRRQSLLEQRLERQDCCTGKKRGQRINPLPRSENKSLLLHTIGQCLVGSEHAIWPLWKF